MFVFKLIIPKEGQPITAHTRYYHPSIQRSQRVSANRYKQVAETAIYILNLYRW
jgi:hypothetical protein